MAKKSGGGGCLVVVLVLALLGFGYYKWQHGSSSAPPDGADTGGGSGRYVALGDSYTSSPRTGRQAGTPAGCQRSDDNYPHLVSAKLKPAQFADVSCGGATTAHLTAPQKTDDGTNPAQLDAVTKDTTLVTLGIGGNDVGFFAYAAGCTTAHSTASPCKDKLTAGGHDQLAERIDAAAPKVGAILDRIHTKAPKAKVVVVGYPTVLPDGDGCWPVLPFGSGDIAYFREALGKLNKMLEDQADSHRAGYADTATPGKGHDVCSASDTRWVEGLLPASPAAPLHPNARGEQGMADAVLAVLKLP
ncbi:lysophospholipase L1-like esterase [Amycolatopsis lexingtonensis]|uniref:Lysophospholipase L1-like esterase n=1 Tax=Amycolatopsis lexingtonensis TaxID=218822 RepID=A0ABR9I753_9PSEU|nr:SGNH/GDSL hydrolase family protein [Amycolatopsis lexingtonensis]MBE1499026.1 lysophospholipase L1-like esterase [Amycolatopsis lexingtonensis]